MEAKFSQRVKDVLIYSREEAVRLGNDYIGLEHLLLGIIREGEGLAIKILVALGVDLTETRRKIESAVASDKEKTTNPENLPLIKQSERALKITYLEAKWFNSELIGTEHLLLAILKDENNLVTKLLHAKGVNYEVVKEEVKSIISHGLEEFPPPPKDILPKDDDEEEPEEGGKSFGASHKKGSESKSKTPVLDNFGRDITKAAEEGRLDPIVGRQKELERIAQVLSRRKKKQPHTHW